MKFHEVEQRLNISALQIFASDHCVLFSEKAVSLGLAVAADV